MINIGKKTDTYFISFSETYLAKKSLYINLIGLLRASG